MRQLLIAASILAFIFLGGCSKRPEVIAAEAAEARARVDNRPRPTEVQVYPVAVYMDYGTGCQYITTNSNGGLIKRVNKYGDHICNDADKR